MLLLVILEVHYITNFKDLCPLIWYLSRNEIFNYFFNRGVHNRGFQPDTDSDSDVPLAELTKRKKPNNQWYVHIYELTVLTLPWFGENMLSCNRLIAMYIMILQYKWLLPFHCVLLHIILIKACEKSYLVDIKKVWLILFERYDTDGLNTQKSRNTDEAKIRKR